MKHSENYFHDYRDYWWSKDYIEFLGENFLHKFDSPIKVIDIGSGQGHWFRTIAPLIPVGSEIILVDKEADWLEISKQRNEYLNKDFTISYIQSDIDEVNLKENYFDLVTCQTFLMHMKDPEAILVKMKKIAKNNAAIWISEPQNSFRILCGNNAIDEISPADLSIISYAYLSVNKLRKNDIGDDSIGDSIGEKLYSTGFSNINTILNNSPAAVIPTKTDQEQIFLKEIIANWVKNEMFFNWSKKLFEEYYSKLDSPLYSFHEVWKSWERYTELVDTKITSGNFYGSLGAGVLFLNRATVKK